LTHRCVERENSDRAQKPKPSSRPDEATTESPTDDQPFDRPLVFEFGNHTAYTARMCCRRAAYIDAADSS
jgi:hypothetical protein